MEAKTSVNKINRSGGCTVASAGSLLLCRGRERPQTLAPQHKGRVPAFLSQEDNILVGFS